MSREAMQMALEALGDANDAARMEFSDEDYYSEAINALRQALVDADDTSQERVDETVKTEHDKQIEIAQAYERGWNAALAQQEPVAWISDSPTKGNGKQLHWTKSEAWRWSSNITPLYTAPPQREWVGLTALEIYECWKTGDVVEAVEAKLKEKNT